MILIPTGTALIIFGKTLFLLISEIEISHEIKSDGITRFMDYMTIDFQIISNIFALSSSFISCVADWDMRLDNLWIKCCASISHKVNLAHLNCLGLCYHNKLILQQKVKILSGNSIFVNNKVNPIINYSIALCCIDSTVLKLGLYDQLLEADVMRRS